MREQDVSSGNGFERLQKDTPSFPTRLRQTCQSISFSLIHALKQVRRKSFLMIQQSGRSGADSAKLTSHLVKNSRATGSSVQEKPFSAKRRRAGCLLLAFSTLS